MRASTPRTKGLCLAAALLLGLAVILPACDYLEKQKIEDALLKRADSLQNGEAKKFLSVFSPSYHDRWMDFESMAEKAGKRLSSEPLPVVSFGKQTILVKGEKAMVTESFTLEDRVESRTRRFNEVQHLRMQKQDEEWKIIRGSEVLRLLSGRIEEELEIEKALLRREAALTNEDLKAYMSLVAEDYHHKGNTARDVKEKIVQNFRVYDGIRFRSYDRKIWFFGDAAAVEQKFTMHAVQMGEDMTFSGSERFELIKTGHGWKFSKGLL